MDLVAAGLVEEHLPGAAAVLDTALRTPRLPHTDDEFQPEFRVGPGRERTPPGTVARATATS